MKSQAKRRIFIALNPPGVKKSSIYKLFYDLRKRKLPIKWTPSENLHITLLFLGNMSTGQISNLNILLTQIAKTTLPFPVYLERVKLFSQSNQTIIHLGVLKNDNLLKLQRKIQSGVAPLVSFPQSRKFRPHITVGRCRGKLCDRDGRLRPSLTAAKIPHKRTSWTVRGIDIMESVLGGETPHYLRLRRYNFPRK
jgi:RNA 2',3'-cyclic 3'-phosphodiesterase